MKFGDTKKFRRTEKIAIWNGTPPFHQKISCDIFRMNKGRKTHSIKKYFGQYSHNFLKLHYFTLNVFTKKEPA